MCDDPRTHDTWRTAAALFEAHVRGDTSNDHVLLHREGDKRYPVDVLGRLASLALGTAARLCHVDILPAAAVMVACAEHQVDVSDQFVADATQTAIDVAEYLAIAITDNDGYDKALGIAREYISQLACG